MLFGLGAAALAEAHGAACCGCMEQPLQEPTRQELRRLLDAGGIRGKTATGVNGGPWPWRQYVYNMIRAEKKAVKEHSLEMARLKKVEREREQQLPFPFPFNHQIACACIAMPAAAPVAACASAATSASPTSAPSDVSLLSATTCRIRRCHLCRPRHHLYRVPRRSLYRHSMPR